MQIIAKKDRDWKRAIAWLIFWAWCYALLINNALAWLCIFLTAFSKQIFGTPIAIPIPPAPDLSLLGGASMTLLGIGGIERVGRARDAAPPEIPAEKKTGA